MNNDFKITIPIMRAYQREDGEMFIEGIASSTDVDSHETIFNENCQEGFAIDINRGLSELEPVEIEAEHLGDEEPMNILGVAIRAQVTQDNQLYIQAQLDKDNPKAVYYFKKMTVADPVTNRTKKFGLSINGFVVDADWQFSDKLQKTIRVFNRVQLKKIGIVRAPSNPSTWVEKLIRSVNWENISQKELLMETNSTENIQDVTTEVAADTPVERTGEVVVDEVTEVTTEETTERTEPTIADLIAKIDAQATEIADLKRAMDTTNMAGHGHEDLSDEVDTVEETEEVVETRSDETVETVETEVEEVTERSEGDVTDALMGAVKEYIDGVARSLEDKFTAANDKIEELTRNLESAATEKAELVERIAALENSPVTTPGAQVVEGIVRAEAPKSELADRIERAKAKGDKTELIKLQILSRWHEV